MDKPAGRDFKKILGQVLKRPMSMPARVASNELLGGAVEIIIEHQGRDYRLRLTQNGKLILTA
jgi:hemin uptake protein HemP